MALTKITSEVIESGAVTSTHIANGAISSSHLTSITTDNVSEGSSNTYFTNARARGAVSVTGGNLSYDSSTGVIQLTTDTIRGAISVTDAGGDGSLAYSAGVITYTGPSASEVRAHFSAGTGISINSGEISTAQNLSTSGTPTFGNTTLTGYLRGPSTFTIDPATHGDNTGTVVIAGNLQVDGTTTTINSTTLTVDDKLVTLASGSANASAANGAGIEVDISGVTNPSILYDGTDDQWDFNKNVEIISSDRDMLHLLRNSSNGDAGINFKNTSGNLAQLYAMSSGNIYLDASGEIILDSDSEIVRIYHDGGNIGAFQMTNNDFYIRSMVADKDLIFQGYDSSTRITALTLDMSNAGTATFNHDVKINGTLNLLPSDASDTDAWLLYQYSDDTLRFNFTGAGEDEVVIKHPGSTNARTLTVDTSSKRVGIGTTAPTVDLDISNSSARVKIQDGTSQLNMGLWDGTNHRIEADSTRKFVITSYHTDGIHLGGSGGSDLVIKNDRVGINDTDPDRKLSIIGDSTSSGQYPLSLDATNTDYTLEFRRNGTSEWWIKQAGSSFNLHENGVGDHFRLFAGGDIAIGSHAPSYPLDVQRSSGHTYIRTMSTASNTRAALLTTGEDASGNQVKGYFGSVGDANEVEVASLSNHQIKFYVNNTPAKGMILDTTGNLLIGATSGTSIQLHVDGTRANGLAAQFTNDESSTGSGIVVKGGNNSSTYSADFRDYNGANLMRVRGDGYVGIGTTQPSAKIHVKKTAASTQHYDLYATAIIEDTEARLQLVATDGGSNAAALLLSNEEKHWGVVNHGPNENNTFGIGYYASSSSGGDFADSLSSLLTIKTDGNVGIGESNPTHKLDVNGTGRFQGAITSVLSSSGGAFLSITHTGNEAWSFDARSGSGVMDYVDFGIAGSTRCMTWQEDGKVGIGTNAPSAPLHVLKSDNDVTLLHLSHSSANASTADYAHYGEILIQGGTHPKSGIRAYSNGYQTANSALAFWTNQHGGSYAERMRITGSGLVGIGTNDPSAPLHILTNDSTTNTTVTSLMITNLSTGTTTTGFGGEIRFQAERNNGVNQNTGAIRSVAEVNSGTNISSGLRFDTSTAGVNYERMRITYAGHVGIGVASSASVQRKLHIVGPDGSSGLTEGNSRAVLYLDNAGATYVNIASGNTSNGAIFFSDPNANNRGAVLYEHLTDSLVLKKNGSEVLRMSGQTNVAYTADGLFNSNARPHTFQSTTGGAFVLGYRDHGSGLYQAAMGLSYDNIDGLGNTAYRDAFVLKETSNGGQEHFRISGNGNVANTNNSYGQISDERVKTDIVDASSQWDDIKAVRVRKFKFGTAPEGHDFLQIGVISQELEAAGMNGLIEESDPDDSQIAYNPELVGQQIKTVKYSVLYMKAIKALQEAMDRIEQLEARVTELEE